MLDSSTLFTIPDSELHDVPCQIAPQLYTNPALDIDVDEDDWILADLDTQQQRLDAKERAEATAVAACHGCPMLTQCRNWALTMGQDVFGVAGGLTQAERPNHTQVVAVTDYTARGPQGQVRDDLIDRWVKAGISNKQIAERLGCNVRTVERRRAGLSAGNILIFDPEAALAGTPETPADNVTSIAGAALATAAKVALIPQRVTPETAAIFDALLDGRLHDRDDVIAAATPLVDRVTALATAPKGRSYASSDAQAIVGARKFVLNRVDIAVRRGRIRVVKDLDSVQVCLSPETATVWRSYRNAALATA